MSHKAFNEERKHSMYKDQLYCDVKFNCVDPSESSGKSSIGAHKIILSIASDVFETMFYGQFAQNCMKDTGTEVVEIDDIEIKVFKIMLSFIYGIDIEIQNVDEGCDLYNAIHKYNVKDAVELVSAYLLENLHAENAIYIYEATVLYGNKDLENGFLKVLSENTFEIIANPSFLNAMPETLKLIFGYEDLNIESELELVKALKRYIDENFKIDKNLFGEIRPVLECIRFLTLSPEILCNYVHDTGLLTAEEIVNIIACQSLETDYKKMPKGFSQNKTKRPYVRQKMVDSLSWIDGFSSKPCYYCRLSTHVIWKCSYSFKCKTALRTFYKKYNHFNLKEYEPDDLFAVYNFYKELGPPKTDIFPKLNI